MIAIASRSKRTVLHPRWHRRFLEMLPAIRRYALSLSGTCRRKHGMNWFRKRSPIVTWPAVDWPSAGDWPPHIPARLCVMPFRKSALAAVSAAD